MVAIRGIPPILLDAVRTALTAAYHVVGLVGVGVLAVVAGRMVRR